MGEVKSLYASKVFWGAVVTVVAPLLSEVGIDVGDQQGWVEGIVGLIGAGLAVYGRVKATKKVKVV